MFKFSIEPFWKNDQRMFFFVSIHKRKKKKKEKKDKRILMDSINKEKKK